MSSWVSPFQLVSHFFQWNTILRVFIAAPWKSSSGNLYPDRTLSTSTKGLNLTYMPQGDVEKGDDAHIGAKPTPSSFSLPPQRKVINDWDFCLGMWSVVIIKPPLEFFISESNLCFIHSILKRQFSTVPEGKRCHFNIVQYAIVWCRYKLF